MTRKIDSNTPAAPGLREQRLHVRAVAAGEAERREDRERRQQPERHHVLEHAARRDAAVVDEDDERGQHQADREARRENRRAGDRVELGTQFSAGKTRASRLPVATASHGHTIAYARIIVQPAREADQRRKDPFGVRDLGARVADALDEPAVGVGDRKQQQAADEEAEHRAARSAARQPVVHQDDPADADHRAESEGEVLDRAQVRRRSRLAAGHQNFNRSRTGAASF